MRQLQTTLTRIFIVLESESHGLSEIMKDFSAKIGNSNAFSAQKQVISKNKKVFTEIETDFSARIGNLNNFSGRITATTPQLRHPNSFGGELFSFFQQKSASKAPKMCDFAYFTGQWGGARAPLATLLNASLGSKINQKQTKKNQIKEKRLNFVLSQPPLAYALAML